MSAKKELKDAYKQMKFKVGVFQVRNTVNGKIFVGSNVNLDAIWNRLKVQLNFGSHNDAALQADWTAFGEDKFRFEILSEIEQNDGETRDYSREVKELEAMYIDELQPFDEKGYNRRRA